jgi:pimeloyl-ACP methyl ester carboxylesterase
VLEVGMSTAFGCTLQGRVEPAEVLRLLRAVLDAGADRVGLADTVGYADPAMVRSLFEAAFAAVSGKSPAKVDTDNSTRGPLLVTAGGHDHTVPATISHQTVKLYRKSSAVTDLKEFPDRGHSLTIDGGWREVADSVLGWLAERRL